MLKLESQASQKKPNLSVTKQFWKYEAPFLCGTLVFLIMKLYEVPVSIALMTGGAVLIVIRLIMIASF